MVAPERQRQGLGEVLFRTWDRNVGASLGLGLSESSYRLFQKLRWPDVGPVPCLVKPLTRRALRRPNWPVPLNRLVSAVTLPIVKIVARTRPLRAEVRLIRRFDDSFTELWERAGAEVRLRGAARRRVPELEVRLARRTSATSIAALRRDDRNVGYAVYRHFARAARPGDAARRLPGRSGRRGRRSRRCCAGSIARRGPADSDKIRTFAMHAGFRRVLKTRRLLPGEVDDGVRRQGERASTPPPAFYDEDRPAGTSRSATRTRIDDGAGRRLPRRCRHASARRHRHRRRQPVGRGGARATRRSRTSTRCRALHALLRAARRAADLRRSRIRSPRDPRSADVLRALLGAATARSARITTPGKRRRAQPADMRRHPYALDAAARQFEAQLDGADRRRSSDAVGARPVSYRSGRFGFSAVHVVGARTAGYLVESSVAPLFYEAHKGGPEFVEAPLTPYFLAYDSATRPGRATCSECRSRPR